MSDGHGRGDYSEETSREIDNDVRRIIDEQRERVAALLAEHNEVLVKAAHVLLARETISGDELRAIMREHEAQEASARQERDAEAAAHDGDDAAAAWGV